MPVQRVAVLGGGISGLVSAKTCLEEGLQPVCFEEADQYGGVWVIRDKNIPGKSCGSIYDCLITNSSKEMMCFSDFPFDASLPPYLRGNDLLPYYQNYARHFGVDKCIRLNTKVVRVEPTENFEQTGQWRVRSQTNDGDTREEIFDAVMVCTGLHSEAYTPDIPGMDQFEGRIVHSNEFKTGYDYADQTVVVVGSSHSAGDVAVDTSRHAKQTYLAMRNGTWVLPRQAPNSTPFDAFINRRVMGLIPFKLRRKKVRDFLRNRMDHESLGLQSNRELFNSASIMVNDDIGIRIWCGALKSKPNIQKFTKNGVVFEDGTSVDNVDAVIFATGYDFRFPYMDRSILQDSFEDVELYLHVIAPRLRHHTLGVIGTVATVGAQGPVFEMQARYAVRVFKGAVSLPSEEEMVKDVDRRRAVYFKLYGRHKIFFPPIPYMDMLAEKIGCRPSFMNLLVTDPQLAYRFIFGSNYPPFYRLVGPHPWKGAREAIFRGPSNVTEPTKTRLANTTEIVKTEGYIKKLFSIVFLGLLFLVFLK